MLALTTVLSDSHRGSIWRFDSFSQWPTKRNQPVRDTVEDLAVAVAVDVAVAVVAVVVADGTEMTRLGSL